MSEVENNEEVAVAETEQGGVQITDFINAVADQNFNRAKDHFDNLLNVKLDDAIDAERVAVADTIFNDAPEEPEMELDDADDAFDEDEADFTGITGSRDLHLSALIHKRLWTSTKKDASASTTSNFPVWHAYSKHLYGSTMFQLI